MQLGSDAEGATGNGLSAPLQEFREQAATQVAALVDRLMTTACAQADTAVREALERQHAAIVVVRAQLDQQAKQLRALTAELDEARAESETLSAELQLERDRADAARAEVVHTTKQFEDAFDRMRLDHATALRQHAFACTTLPLDELLSVFNALAKATTLSAVLNVLVAGLARQFARVALFSVQGKRLEGVQQVGFDFERDISKLAIPLTVDSLLTQSVTTGHVESLVAGTESESGSSPFGGKPVCAVALPIVVHGETLAVIYAEDSESMEPDSMAPQLLAKFTDLLLQHALLVLLRVSAEQKALGELRDYVTTLVTEIEYAYAEEVEAGRSEAECQDRLRQALDRAHRLYAQRSAREAPAVASFLDDRLTALVQARIATPFERALAGVLRSKSEAGSSGLAFAG